ASLDAVAASARWQARLRSARGGTMQVAARCLVNAAGPWAGEFLTAHAHVADRVQLRLVKGSHLVVKRLFDNDLAYIFQTPDGRIIFAIPYERDFTLIGTTEVDHPGEIGEARADAKEIEYLCAQANRYFARAITPDAAVST